MDSVSLDAEYLLRFISKVSFSSLPYNHLRLTDSSRHHSPDSYRQIGRYGFLDSIYWIQELSLLFRGC